VTQFSYELVPMRWGLVGFGSKGIDPSGARFMRGRASVLCARGISNRYVVAAESGPR